MLVEKNAPLQQYNTFGIMARAMNLVRVQSEQDIREFLAGPPLGASRQVVVLGGGSNIVITGDVEPTVFKMEIMGKRLVAETDRHYIIEVGAGEVNLLPPGHDGWVIRDEPAVVVDWGGAHVWGRPASG